MDMEKPINILLTSAGRRSYLVKYFQEAVNGNGKIHAANSTDASTALQAADEAVLTPMIYDRSYIPFLLEYCKENRIDAVVPLFDMDLAALSKHKEQFQAIGTVPVVSDSRIIDLCSDKWNMHHFLKEHGFDVLPTFIRMQDVWEALKNGQADFPLILKPRWGTGSIAVCEAWDERELEVLYGKVRREIFQSYLKYTSMADADHCVLVQVKADGQEYGLDIISDLTGNYCTTITRKKAGMRSGETDCATIVDMPKLAALGKQLASVARHIANMDADVVVSGRKSYVLDMNARFGGGYPFSHAAGVNLPLAVVKWLREEEVPSGLLIPENGITAQKEISITVLKKGVTGNAQV